MKNGEMRLNDAVKTIYYWWDQITNKYPHIQLDHFIIMPNYTHGIIIINDFDDDVCIRGDVYSLLLQSPLQISPNHISLGKKLAYFKYQSTKTINQKHKTYGMKLWQRNYYEYIIRNENELNRIRRYIIENPFKLD